MEELLNNLGSIYPLSQGAIEYFSINLKTKKLHKKDFLLKIGQVSENIYFIHQGLIRCFYLVDGKEVSSWFMKEGDVMISVESFFKQAISYESIQAVEESIVHYITYKELQYVYKNFIEFNIIGRILTERYYTLSEQRLHSIRLQKARDRYLYLLKYHPELILRVPSKFLASYLGVTEVTLSNIKGELQIS